MRRRWLRRLGLALAVGDEACRSENVPAPR
jgi:hypothetical protein